MSTYVQLRKKLQITTMALAELAAEKSEKMKDKYLNLLMFRIPEDENKEEDVAPIDVEAGRASKDGKKDGKKKKSNVTNSDLTLLEGQEKKRNLLEILLYNLEEVDVTNSSFKITF
jgi:hypothetical protein